ncbi:hypothetical protein [Streptococcus pluranimalium]|uniref:hypothetical protein n=1 Tax=Streptococcus pluranimalium TaxID=82348 RepID=UPI003F68E3D9
MSEEKPKHEIKIQVTQDNTFQLQFAITEDRENPPELIALELLKTTVASLAERLNVKPEFLAETMYHDFTKGDFIEVDN